MNRRFLSIVIVFAFAAVSAVTAHGSGKQSTEQNQAAGLAQTKAQSSAADSSSPQAQQKKVWTNEELSSLNPHAGVSTVGNRVDNGAKHAISAENRDPKWYQGQIAKLQAKIPPLDSQIAELQAGLAGKPTGDGEKSVRP